MISTKKLSFKLSHPDTLLQV